MYSFISLVIGGISIPVSVYRKNAALMLMAVASVILAALVFRPGDLITYFAFIGASVFFATSVYSIRYSDSHGRWLTPLFLFTIEGMMIILVSRNYLELIAGWEVMSVPAYATVALNKTEHSPAFVFMLFSEISTFFIVLAAILSYFSTGGTSLSFVNAGPIVLFLISIGAMTKMGITPFMISEWLPIAHGNAPANSSAIFSAGMRIKYG